MGADNTYGETNFNPEVKHLEHIEIKNDKVIFVYYELPKPKEPEWLDGVWAEIDYPELLKEYEASRREAEVENVFWDESVKLWMYDFIMVKHSQPCEAEVIDGKATITKIL